MAIKRRERRAVDSAVIDSFGDAAEKPAENRPAPAATPVEPATRQAADEVPSSGWPEGLPKTFLVRYSDPTLPQAIEELKDLVGRNKHQTVLLALRRGIDVLRREAEELGERAELLK